MNIDLLREQLEIDEGIKHEIYLDHLGYPTFGIGHLVTESDPEQGQSLTGSLKPSNRISKASCLTATDFTRTSTICRKRLSK